MDWTRRATINEQTDETTADNRVLINFLPPDVCWGLGCGINIKYTREFVFPYGSFLIRELRLLVYMRDI